jgi:gamma-glutamyl-gamma-aminobutyrate hydrolase PuuD
MSHPGQHSIKVKDIDTNLFTKEIAVNNIHHQCVWTENKLVGDNFEVYGFCSLSKKHHYQEDEQIQCEFEPEIIWFPKVKALGVQFHPEMMDNMSWKDTISYLEKLVNKLF